MSERLNIRRLDTTERAERAATFDPEEDIPGATWRNIEAALKRARAAGSEAEFISFAGSVQTLDPRHMFPLNHDDKQRIDATVQDFREKEKWEAGIGALANIKLLGYKRTY